MGACHCSGGDNCCMNRWQIPSAPFKCPDCGTWWTGSHRCDPIPLTTTTTTGGAWCNSCRRIYFSEPHYCNNVTIN